MHLRLAQNPSPMSRMVLKMSKFPRTSLGAVVMPALVPKLGFILVLSLPALLLGTGHAQTLPITSGQRATATQVAQAGVPLSELAADAPDSHTVKSGDTLWGISGMFLKSPWRWPELWGMNMSEIKNPHLIFPGQQLFLEKSGGRARLRMGAAGAGSEGIQSVRVTPRTRSASLADTLIPTLKSQFIEPFLAEPVILDEQGLAGAARIVATQEGRVVLSRGDRAYARGPAGQPIALSNVSRLNNMRVVRNAVPLKDPLSGEILGYEAAYLGKAQVVSAELRKEIKAANGDATVELVPAGIDIFANKEEMRVGDRLVPEPERGLTSYVPHAPSGTVDARVVSIYGSAVNAASQNQVISINRGIKDGIEVGHVLAILKDGPRVTDKTTLDRESIKLPNERNGLAMVFRIFERLSYALILDITEGVRVGDHLVNPRE